jgi:hypothetical protein
MTQPTCASCRFWQWQWSSEAERKVDGNGFCRRYPEHSPSWYTQWCGEHKPAKTIVTINDTP